MPTLTIVIAGTTGYGDASTGSNTPGCQMPYPSSIVGMINAAMGNSECDSQWYTRLTFGGVQLSHSATRIDFNIIQHPLKDASKSGGINTRYEYLHNNGTQHKETFKRCETGSTITKKTYIDDNLIVIAIESDHETLQEIKTAFNHPKWLVSYGKSQCLPTVPLTPQIYDADMAYAIKEYIDYLKNDNPVTADVFNHYYNAGILRDCPILFSYDVDLTNTVNPHQVSISGGYNGNRKFKRIELFKGEMSV